MVAICPQTTEPALLLIECMMLYLFQSLPITLHFKCALHECSMCTCTYLVHIYMFNSA